MLYFEEWHVTQKTQPPFNQYTGRNFPESKRDSHSDFGTCEETRITWASLTMLRMCWMTIWCCFTLDRPTYTKIHYSQPGSKRAANTFILPLNSFVETNTSNTSPQLWPPSLTSKCSASGNRCFKTSKIFNSVSVRTSSESLLEYSLFYDLGGRKSHFKFTHYKY